MKENRPTTGAGRLRAAEASQEPARETDSGVWTVSILVNGVLVQRETVTAELQLGEQAKFYPTDAALASWTAQADKGLAQVVYE